MDWVSFYAAGLSTLLALIGLWNWWRRDVFLTVHGVHQSENLMGKDAIAFAVTNSGRRAIIVWRVCVTFSKSKNKGSTFGESIFDHSTHWNPATKNVPVEGTPNKSKREPNVLQPGDEIHGMASPNKEYDPQLHWIKVTAFARNSSRAFSTWIPPKKKEG